MKLRHAALAATALLSSTAEAVNFSATGTAQSMTIGQTGIYTLNAVGGEGGRSSTNRGGAGAAIGARQVLASGDLINVYVGVAGARSTGALAAGGGGGTFLVRSGSALVVAGGGGGGGAGFLSAGGGGTLGGSSLPSLAGGTNAFSTDPSRPTGQGGYGGGGASGGPTGNRGAGGGGGYTGGNGGGRLNNSSGPGGGGGSFVHSSAFVISAGLGAASEVWETLGRSGSASIDPTRLFAKAALGQDTLTIVSRAGTSATASTSLANEGLASFRNAAGATVAGDRLVYSASAGAFSLSGGELAGGASKQFTFTAPTAAGIYNETKTITLSSVGTADAGLGIAASYALGTKQLTINATVTELASATFSSTGAGSFSAVGDGYLLDLGSITKGASLSAALVVTNGVANSGFAESLGGDALVTSRGLGFSYSARSFSGLSGGQSETFATLGFDSTDLLAGDYSANIDTFLFSRFLRLDDQALAGRRITVRATVVEAAAAVPEPASWAMMIAGFGLVGGAMRRRVRLVAA